MEERTDQLEEETAGNREDIQKTQKDLDQVKEEQENLRITERDAEQIALNWVAANIQGITVPHRQWDFKEGKYSVFQFEVDNTSEAKRVDQEILSVTKTDDGFLVTMMLTFKGFTFTNDRLHWEVGIVVDEKGIATQKYIKFSY